MKKKHNPSKIRPLNLISLHIIHDEKVSAFFKINIFRKLRITMSKFSHWNESVVSIVWVSLENLMQAMEKKYSTLVNQAPLRGSV